MTIYPMRHPKSINEFDWERIQQNGVVYEFLFDPKVSNRGWQFVREFDKNGITLLHKKEKTKLFKKYNPHYLYYMKQELLAALYCNDIQRINTIEFEILLYNILEPFYDKNCKLSKDIVFNFLKSKELNPDDFEWNINEYLKQKEIELKSHKTTCYE